MYVYITEQGNDFYIMIIDNELNNLIYATYYGGSQSAEHFDGGTSRFDKKGVIFCVCCTGKLKFLQKIRF